MLKSYKFQGEGEEVNIPKAKKNIFEGEPNFPDSLPDSLIKVLHAQLDDFVVFQVEVFRPTAPLFPLSLHVLIPERPRHRETGQCKAVIGTCDRSNPAYYRPQARVCTCWCTLLHHNPRKSASCLRPRESVGIKAN